MNAYKSGQKLRDAFNKLDFDRDGYIALNELPRSLALVDIHDELTNKQQKRLCRAYYHIDADQDGRLDYNEFVRAITKPDYHSSFWQRILYRTADVVIPFKARERTYNQLNERWFKPPPFFILLVSIAQIASHAWNFSTHQQLYEWLDGCWGCFEPNSGEVAWPVYANFRRYQLWRYFSYSLVHSGFFNIAGNVLVQILIGIPLELVHKFWTVGSLYIIGVFLGSLLQIVLDPQTIVIGASGGCYALLLVHLITLLLNWRQMKLMWLRITLLCLFFGVDICLIINRRLTPSVCPLSEIFVSWTPHLGGLIAGLAFASYFFILNRFDELEHCCCLWMRIFGFIFLSCFIAALICLNVILPMNVTDFRNFTCNLNKTQF